MGMKHFFLKKEIQNGRLKKMRFLKSPILKYFFIKRSIFLTLLKMHCCPIFLFLELKKFWLLAYLLFPLTVSVRLENIDIRHFIRLLPMIFWQITKSKNIKKGGTLIECCPTLLKLCTVKGNLKISKFKVSSFKNKKSGQQCTFQNVWKILLSQIGPWVSRID